MLGTILVDERENSLKPFLGVILGASLVHLHGSEHPRIPTEGTRKARQQIPRLKSVPHMSYDINPSQLPR